MLFRSKSKGGIDYKSLMYTTCKALKNLKWHPDNDELALKYYMVLGMYDKFDELDIGILIGLLDGSQDIDKRRTRKFKEAIVQALLKKGYNGVYKIVEYLFKYNNDKDVFEVLIQGAESKVVTFLENMLYSDDIELHQPAAEILNKITI